MVNNQYTNPWTQKEIDFIKENYKTLTYKEISNKINRSEKGINSKMGKLGLSVPKYERRIFKNTHRKNISLAKEGCKAHNKGKFKCSLTKEKLMDLYINKKLSSKQIALEQDISYGAILNKLKYFKTPIRNYGDYCRGKKRGPFTEAHKKNISKAKEINISKKQLYDLYIIKQINAIDISQKMGYSCQTILRNLQKYNIPLRSKSEVKKRMYEEGKISSPFKKGHISWNHSLTKKTDERLKKMGEKHSKIMKKLYLQGKLKHLEKLKFKRGDPKLIARRAKQIFPIKDTSIEIKLQQFLTQLGIEFFTHTYRKEIKHGYQCDIWIPSKNLVIEADGDYWHGNPDIYSKEQLNEMQIKQQERDNVRTKELLEKGFKVLRLWESEIKEMTVDDFQNKIQNKVGGNL